jgi:multiple sugar transport system permease protein
MVSTEIRNARRYSRSSGLAVLFSLPGLLLLISVVLAPLITGFYYSLTNSSLISSEPTKFVGLANYQSDVFSVTFGEALKISLLITFFSILTQLTTGYVIAKVLSRSMRGTSFFVSVIMLPMLLTPVAIGMMWSLMLNPDIGTIRWLQSFVGLDINFLSSPSAAMSAIIFLEWWGHLPFVVLVLMAGILNLPKEVLESASIDGANWWQTNLRVIIPMLAPVIAVIVIIRSVNAFRMFDTIFVLTSGGPGNATVNLPFLAFKTAFTYFDTSRASAISVAIVAIVMPVYFIFLKMTKV